MPKYTIDGTTLSDVADAVRELDGDSSAMTPAQMASRIRAVQPGGADLSVIADDYDTTATYDVGDYCIHEGDLYVCTTAISTAEAWTAGHWEEVTVGDELSDLKSDLNELDELMDIVEIKQNTEQALYHSDLLHSTNVRFIGNEWAFDTAKFANRKNIMPNVTMTQRNVYGIECSRSGRFIQLNGTATKTLANQVYNSNLASAFPAGTYKVVISFDLGDSVLIDQSTQTRRFAFTLKHENGDYVRVQNYILLPERKFTNSYTVTVEYPVTALYLTCEWLNGDVLDGFKVWYGVFDGDVEFTDSEEYVATETVYDYVIDSFEPVIDTCQHESIVTSAYYTKEYIDKHVPEDMVTEESLGYITPEMKGAAGDGNRDDTIEFQAAVDYAIAKQIPFRAFGSYKTTQPIVFSQLSTLNSSGIPRYNYYINKLNYTGNSGYAVIIHGGDGRFIFGLIVSSADGVYLTAVSNKNTHNNYIFANYVISDGTSFSADRDDGETGSIYYNVIRIITARSSHGNCYHNGSGVYCGENRYYDGRCVCPNGWAIHGANGKYYNFTMENNCKNGVYLKSGDNGHMYGFRIAELTSNYVEGESGYVLKCVGHGIAFRLLWPETPIKCIDLSEMDSATDVSSVEYRIRGILFDGTLVGKSYSELCNRALIRNGKIICSPKFESKYVVSTSTLDLTVNNPVGYPTKFVIDAENCVIKLSSSYCSAGYKSFVVDQSTPGKTCTIYSDYDVAPIFDGETLGNGVYRVTAYCDGNNVYTGASTAIIYDGTNNLWEIEKLN